MLNCLYILNQLTKPTWIEEDDITNSKNGRGSVITRIITHEIRENHVFLLPLNKF